MCVEIRPPLPLGSQLHRVPQLKILHLSVVLCEYGDELGVDDGVDHCCVLVARRGASQVQGHRVSRLDNRWSPPLGLHSGPGVSTDRVLPVACVADGQQPHHHRVAGEERQEVVERIPLLERHALEPVLDPALAAVLAYSQQLEGVGGLVQTVRPLDEEDE